MSVDSISLHCFNKVSHRQREKKTFYCISIILIHFPANSKQEHLFMFYQKDKKGFFPFFYSHFFPSSFFFFLRFIFDAMLYIWRCIIHHYVASQFSYAKQIVCIFSIERGGGGIWNVGGWITYTHRKKNEEHWSNVQIIWMNFCFVKYTFIVRVAERWKLMGTNWKCFNNISPFSWNKILFFCCCCCYIGCGDAA